jgi:hypothetical protein
LVMDADVAFFVERHGVLLARCGHAYAHVSASRVRTSGVPLIAVHCDRDGTDRLFD